MNEQDKYHTEHINGQKHMECRVCGDMVTVSDSATSVLCHLCVNESYNKDFPYQPTQSYVPTGRPRGWAFMKEFVDKDGNVFYRGKEQPKLKGTLPSTIIQEKPKKPKLSKAQRALQRVQQLSRLHALKKQLNKAKYKKDIRKITSEVKKIQRQLKK